MDILGPYIAIIASFGLWIAQFRSGLEHQLPNFGTSYLLAILFLLITVVIGGFGTFLISRKKLFPIFIIIIALPGLIGLLDPSFKNILVDSDQNITLGAINDPGGYISFAIALGIFCLLGWGLSLIIIRITKNADWTRHVYDHIWFIIVVAGLLFVVQEVRVRGEEKEFSQTMQLYRMATSELIGQLETARKICIASNETPRPNYLDDYTPSQNFCDWAQYSLSSYRSLAANVDINYATMQSESYSDALSKAGPQYYDRDETPESWNTDIEHEIQLYNQHFCAKAYSAVECKHLPFSLDGLIISENYKISSKAALSVQPLTLKLQELGKAANALRDPIWNHQSRHLIRMLFSVFLAFLIGGKIAISTVALTDFRPKNPG